MAEKKFEVAMKRLEEIVQGMEGNDLPLEDALKDFEEGVGLVKFCSKKLEEAEKKVTILIQESGGKHRQVPFDLEEEKDAE
jgi:exodeoxyribonuclease VII small subunit